MIKTISQKLTIFFINNNIISQRRKEWCEYALETRLVTTVALLFMTFMGSIFFSFYDTAIFLIIFMLIRKSSGGYHASKNYLCVIGSAVLIGAGLKMSSALQFLSINTLITLYSLATATILFLAPVNHPNMDLSSKEITELKRVIKYKMLAVTAFLLLLVTYFNNKLYLVVISSVIMVALTVGLAKIIGQEVK